MAESSINFIIPHMITYFAFYVDTDKSLDIKHVSFLINSLKNVLKLIPIFVASESLTATQQQML